MEIKLELDDYQTPKQQRKWWQLWKGRKISRKETTKVSTGHTIVRSRRLTIEEWQSTVIALQKQVAEEEYALQKRSTA